eukprot:TRINITY_DN7817_c0_g4_i5.p1 TRINITY_DN7817_c0_g4~~TRINITY_DN7817_c0_g4_i5.p1  ORF type:complete len:449 (-),score=78.11 TRINITY_DN7817_c0_g4_i5:131-1477(-)
MSARGENSSIQIASRKHHVRANTRCQDGIPKGKVTEIVKELLQNCGAAPRKLTNFKAIFHSTKQTAHLPPTLSNSQATTQAHSYSTFILHIDFLHKQKRSHISLVNSKESVRRKEEVVRENLGRRRRKCEELEGCEEVNKMVYNFPCHAVAVFKDYLIADDSDDFVCRIYDLDVARSYLSNLSQRYSKERVLPNYLGFGMRKIFAKREKWKAKVKHMNGLERMSNGREESSIFKSAFINSLLRDDKSFSIFTSERLSTENKNIDELLMELSRLVSTRNSQQKEFSIPKHQERHQKEACKLDEEKSKEVLLKQLSHCHKFYRHRPSNSTAIFKTHDNNSMYQSSVNSGRLGGLKSGVRLPRNGLNPNPSARAVRINCRNTVANNSLPRIKSSNSIKPAKLLPSNSRALLNKDCDIQNVGNLKEIVLNKAVKKNAVYRISRVRFNSKIKG